MAVAAMCMMVAETLHDGEERSGVADARQGGKSGRYLAFEGLVNKFTMLVGPYAHRIRPVER
jgi:hypothetical protein